MRFAEDCAFGIVGVKAVTAEAASVENTKRWSEDLRIIRVTIGLWG
jgi:hypothetical protein